MSGRQIYDKSAVITFTQADQHVALDMLEGLRFHLLHMRYAEVSTDWNTTDKPRCDGSHYIHFVCKDEAHIRWAGGSLSLEPGHAFYLPANVPVHAFTPRRYAHFFLAFRCAWHSLSDIFWDWPTPLALGCWDAGKFTDIWHHVPLEISELWRIHIMVQRMFAEHFEQLEDVIRRANSLHLRFSRMFALLSGTPHAGLRVAELANAQCMTENAFSRLFREHFGTNPKDYLNQRLNQEACQLLLGSDLPIKQISTKLGFSDEYYFNRFFHRSNSISPARYRRRFLMK